MEHYSSPGTHRHYGGPTCHGLRAALESRVERAYRALRDAETARQRVLALDLEAPQNQFQECAEDEHLAFEDIHILFTDRRSSGLTVDQGASCASSHLIDHPTTASRIRTESARYHEIGTTFCRALGYARACGDFDNQTETYDLLWHAAIAMIGNTVAIEQALSDGFEQDGQEYLLRKAGNWY